MTIIDKYNEPLPDLVDDDSWIGVFFLFIEDMISAGWQALGSGDGIRFENSGQKVAGASFGRLVTPAVASLVDGETFVLDDGTNPAVTFEFDDNASVSETPTLRQVDISGITTEVQVRDTIVTAINAAGALDITAEIGFVNTSDPANTAVAILKNDAAGTSGNTTSSETVTSGDFDLSDMAGGSASGGSGSGGVFHLFTAVHPIPTVAPGVPPTADTWGNVSGSTDFFGATWLRLGSPAGAEHAAEYLFQLQFASSPGRGHTLIAAYCRGAQRFDKGADNWQRPDVNTGTALFIGVDRAQYTPSVHDTGAWHPSAQGGSHWVIGDDTVDFDFYLITNRRSDTVLGNVFMVFGRLRTLMGQDRSDLSDDPDPYVHIWTMETGGSVTTNDFEPGGPLARPDEAVNPERLEDVITGSGNNERLVASYGLGDPVAEAGNIDGHYSVAICPPAVGSSAAEAFAFGLLGTDRLTANSILFPLLSVMRSSDVSTVNFRFWKGALKNELFLVGGHQDVDVTSPRIEKRTDELNRLSWGLFSIYWNNAAGPVLRPE